MPALTALIGVTFLIVLWQGGRLVMINRISLGEWIAFNMFLGQLIWPMVALGWVTNIFQRGAASMGRMNYVLDAKATIDDSAAGFEGVATEDSTLVQDAGEIRGEINFKNLTFAYPSAGNGSEAKPVLKDINLHIPAGSTLAIVGPDGKRQIHVGRAGGPALGSASGIARARRPFDSKMAARIAATRARIRAAGYFFIQRETC